MSKLRVLGALALCSLTASTCATVTTKKVAYPVTADSAGVTYFLPKRLIRVVATREPVDLAALKKKAKAAADAATEAEKASKDAETAHKDLVAIIVQLKVGTRAYEEAVAARDLAAADFEGKKKKSAEAAKTSLDAAATVLRAEIGKAGCLQTLKLELLPAQADMSYRLVAKHSHNWFRDDQAAVTVSNAGLLSSSKVTAADRTADVLVELAAASGGLGARGGRGDGEDKAAEECAKAPRQYVTIFDPVSTLTAAGTSTKTIDDVNSALAKAEFPFRIVPDLSGMVTDGETQAFKASADAAADFSQGAEGALFYRSPAPMMFLIQQAYTPQPASTGTPTPATREDGEATTEGDSRTKQTTTGTGTAPTPIWQPVEAFVFLLPQAGPVSYIPLRSSMFAKTVDDVQFSDGVVTSWSTDRPSEALEVVRLPLRLVKSMLSARIEIVTLRASADAKDKTLLESQQAEMETAHRFRALKTCISQAEAKGESGLECFDD